MNPTPVPWNELNSEPTKEELRTLVEVLRSALSGGGGGSTFDPMEARVARLEEDMREIKSDLKALREEMRSGFKELRDEIRALATEVNGLKVEAAEIKGRIAYLPTVWQTNMQMIGLIFTVMGGAFLIVKYGLH